MLHVIYVNSQRSLWHYVPFIFLQHMVLYKCVLIDLAIYMDATCTPCPGKSIPDIFDRKLKNSYQILIIFGMNVSDTTCHQMTIQFPTFKL